MDGLENQLMGKARVIRLDVLSQVGQQAAARYSVRGVPAMIIVDGQGRVIYGQAGIPQTSQIIEQVDAVLISN